MAALAYDIARGLAEGALDALIEKGPQLMAIWRAANTTTMTDAPTAPPDLVAGLNKEITDATK
jgi:hypothetical protein